MSSTNGKGHLFVLDDEQEVVDYLVEMLEGAGYSVIGSTSPLDALELVTRASIDLVIADVEMPEMRGIEFLTRAREANPRVLVVLITAFGSIELGVQAVRLGASDFVTKPFKIEVLLLAVERALRERQLCREIVRLRANLSEQDNGDVVARSKAMQRALELARRAAATDLTVLITGESGCGKGVVARYIHKHSEARGGPFLQVNCASLPPQLLEAELFGVQKGAYTDARETRPGLFVEASGGTLFLDEIAEVPIEAQAKLLQVLESGRVRPLGKATEVEVSVRVIAATNQPLETALRERQFRPDLYYRLNVLRLDLPPLRERPEDVMALIDAFLHRASERLGRPIAGISAGAMRKLLTYGWPGNVRELRNTIERAVALADHDTLCPEDIRIETVAADTNIDPVRAAVESGAPLEEVERAYIRRVLGTTGGNKVHAARILGIDRRTLRRKLGGRDDTEQEAALDS